MSDNFTTTAAPAVFDPAIFEEVTANTATMIVKHPVDDQPTPWKITFAGPGHPQHEALQERLSRKALRKRAKQEAAQVNRSKWKGDDKEPDEARRENVEIIVDQIVGWDGSSVPFSRETAIAMLLKPGYVFLVRQIDDFLENDKVFIKRSATT
ncbi:MAG TPA: hypothetical protein PKZ99_03210 [Azospirillaceae bacterium]|nr:hypothetical protein [Azospirillaceae bacterium]